MYLERLRQKHIQTAKKLSLDSGLLASEIGKAHQKVVENKIKEDAREHSEVLRRERFAAMNAQNSNTVTLVNDTWAYCKESEEEIIYYLLKFGKNEFYPGEALYGQAIPEAVCFRHIPLLQQMCCLHQK